MTPRVGSSDKDGAWA